MSLFNDYRRLDVASRYYVIFMACFWLMGYFSAFWRRVGVPEEGVLLANTILIFLFALISHKKWRYHIRVTDLIFYFLLATVYILNSVIYPQTDKLISKYFVNIVLATLPFLFFGLIFKHKGNERWIILLSQFAVVLNIFYSLLSSSDVNNEEQMNRAYILLPSVLYLSWTLLEHFNFVNFTFFILGVFTEISMGTRGPFVCIIFFIGTYLFFFKKYKHHYTARITIIVVAMLLYSLSTPFAYMMVGILSMVGKSTRIFDLMLDDALVNYENSNGRDFIHEQLFSKLNTTVGEGGFGLLADRLVVGYAHNIFVELWYAYGYIIGSAVIVAFLLLVLSLLIKSNDRDTKVVALLFFTASFVKLLFSGTFLTDGLFFFLIGFCINGIRKAKNDQKIVRM